VVAIVRGISYPVAGTEIAYREVFNVTDGSCSSGTKVFSSRFIWSCRIQEYAQLKYACRSSD
jgi:hypothetical protein